MSKAYGLLGLLFLVVLVGAYLAFNRAEAPTVNDPLPGNNEMNTMSLTLTSPVFAHNGPIPSKYTCDGENINPELRIDGAPEGTETLVLVMDDPDIPESVKESRGIEKFDHWTLYNIPADTSVIPEGESAGDAGITTLGSEAYVGPCPPDREHRYIFRLYALPGPLDFVKTPTLDEVEEAAKSTALESTELIGRYERQ